jgi:hypothetical protein
MTKPRRHPRRYALSAGSLISCPQAFPRLLWKTRAKHLRDVLPLKKLPIEALETASSEPSNFFFATCSRIKQTNLTTASQRRFRRSIHELSTALSTPAVENPHFRA